MSAGSSWTHSSSKALHQLPAVGWQLSSVTTSCPSRSRTTWRAVHGLSTTFQWGKRLRRSEEHTSELQSRFDLVCRLLLEKKNTIETITTTVQIQTPEQ